MKKGQNFLTIISVIIIMAIVYLLFYVAIPIIIEIWQENPISLNFEFKKKDTVVETSDAEIKLISYEDKQIISKIFPNVNIKAKVYYNIYGQIVLEDDTLLDLSNAKIDNNLIENLKLLPNIKEVNLNNQNITKEQKLLLKSTFPYVNFKWKIDILNSIVDSDTQTLNLSGNRITDIVKITYQFKNIRFK